MSNVVFTARYGHPNLQSAGPLRNLTVKKRPGNEECLEAVNGRQQRQNGKAEPVRKIDEFHLRVKRQIKILVCLHQKSERFTMRNFSQAHVRERLITSDSRTMREPIQVPCGIAHGSGKRHCPCAGLSVDRCDNASGQSRLHQHIAAHLDMGIKPVAGIKLPHLAHVIKSLS